MEVRHECVLGLYVLGYAVIIRSWVHLAPVVQVCSSSIGLLTASYRLMTIQGHGINYSAAKRRHIFSGAYIQKVAAYVHYPARPELQPLTDKECHSLNPLNEQRIAIVRLTWKIFRASSSNIVQQLFLFWSLRQVQPYLIAQNGYDSRKKPFSHVSGAHKPHRLTNHRCIIQHCKP
jgi:hypothetical protein